MGLLDNLINRTKSDLEYRAGSEISKKVEDTVRKGLEKKRKCPKCGKALPESALKFCPDCGAKFLVTCKDCNIDYPAGTKFCTQCGKALK